LPVEAKPLFRPDALRPHLKQFQLPRPAEEYRTILAKWAEMLASGKEKQAEVCRLTRDLADAEVELNDRVYRLFNLTPDEIELLQREVEH
jgi:hypothetical protein